MDTKRHLFWLYEQLPELVHKGLISPEQKDAIQSHYGPAHSGPAYNWAFIVISIIGALLVGGGIILIFAYNWDELSRTWRTVLSIAPLVVGLIIYSYMLFRQRHSIAWVEGSATFLMLMLAASIALVSQTYNIMGTTEDFLITWLLPSVILLYLAPSSLCAIIYYIGIANWAVEMRGSESVWYWALLAAGVPHFVWAWRKNERLRYVLTGWALVLTFPFGWFGTIEPEILLYGFWGTALVLGLMYLLESFPSAETHVSPAFQPLRTFSVIAVFVFLMTLTYWDDYDPVVIEQLWKGGGYAAWAVRVNVAVWVAILAGYAWQFARQARQLPLQGVLPAVFPLFLLLLMLIGPAVGDGLPRFLANVFLLLWGVSYLYSGIQHSRMGLVNLGMLIVLMLIAFRFFDTEWSYLAKGIAFVLLGVAFLMVNWGLSKRLKQAG